MEAAHTQHDHVEVHVASLVTGEATTFSMSHGATLKATWDEAYVKLDEARREGDTFLCAGAAEGKSLMDQLELTLRQVREQEVCGGDDAFDFEIKGPSGGA